MVAGEELIFLAWNDLVGVTRGRGVPMKAYGGRKKTGINWAMAGHALTPFEDIADNPWGPMEEAHMTPAPESRRCASSWAMPLIEEDPHDIGADKRRSLGIVELPATLDQALARLEGDAVVKNWFSPNLWRTYLAVKRKEIELMANLSPDEICERYRNAY